jgi:hypothetical protein
VSVGSRQPAVLALAMAGHDVVAVELQAELAAHTQELVALVTGGGSLRAMSGDFYEAEPPGRFDVVAYFDGFGIGSDDDQRRFLRRIVGWLIADGCALIDVLVPSYWARLAGNEEEFPTGSGVRYLDGFDAEGCRMTERMWRVGHEDDGVGEEHLFNASEIVVPNGSTDVTCAPAALGCDRPDRRVRREVLFTVLVVVSSFGSLGVGRST